MNPSDAPIPLVDLKLQHQRIAHEVLPAWEQILEQTAFIGGRAVSAFEEEYAAFTGAAHCVGVANGTDALELALRAAGIGHGDEVIIPANTFVATAEAVELVGGVVRLADCDTSYLIDPASLAEQINPNTKAVIGVDLYGQIAPFEQIGAAVPDGVLIFEDAAQSQGASRHGRGAGTFGVAAGTSFYPGKNLGAYGDAGAVTTNDAELDARLRRIRNHGGVNRYEHLEVGRNSRLDAVQASVLSLKLARLKEWNAERQAAAAAYDDLLAGVSEVETPSTADGNEHVWHLYVVRVPERDRVLADLNAAGIGAGIHYPAPIHQLPAFAHLGYATGDFPVAETTATRILSLPLYPGITSAQQERVVSALLSSLDVR